MNLQCHIPHPLCQYLGCGWRYFVHGYVCVDKYILNFWKACIWLLRLRCLDRAHSRGHQQAHGQYPTCLQKKLWYLVIVTWGSQNTNSVRIRLVAMEKISNSDSNARFHHFLAKSTHRHVQDVQNYFISLETCIYHKSSTFAPPTEWLRFAIYEIMIGVFSSCCCLQELISLCPFLFNSIQLFFFSCLVEVNTKISYQLTLDRFSVLSFFTSMTCSMQ